MMSYLFSGGLFFGTPVLPGNLYMFGLFTPNPLFWVGIGILALSMTSKRVWAIYVSLQLALWMVSVSLWFPIATLGGTTNYDPGVFAPSALVTLAISFVLLAFYKPVIRFLRKFSESNNIATIA
ncbi:hypothetical protein [Ktedonobacter racemifer]|uniref:hypothetical protein n=1 Tax=Ktedonobacter racemifer TaxID=363277 RepID=UPI0012FBA786|nr:hypothetical protein [Ktedonobacter racemifer]